MMSSVMKEQERLHIIECLKLYRELPALWNTKSKVYFDRFNKRKSYQILLKKYQKFNPEATVYDLKRKINSLRSNYRKELKKVMENEDYETTLWYFKELSFISEMNESEGSSEQPSFDMTMSSSMNDTDENSVNESNTSYEDLEDSKAEVIVTGKPILDIDIKPSSNKRPKKDEDPIVWVEEHNDKMDDYYYWAQACAADLRKMDQTQQIFAKRAIAEILMEGRLGLLHRNSVKVNEDLH